MIISFAVLRKLKLLSLYISVKVSFQLLPMHGQPDHDLLCLLGLFEQLQDGHHAMLGQGSAGSSPALVITTCPPVSWPHSFQLDSNSI